MKTEKTNLQVEDIKESILLLLSHQNEIYDKQKSILIRNGIRIGADKFWEAFVEKHGVPKLGERGFSASPDYFIIYYIEDVISEYKKNCFDVKKLQRQIDSLNENPHLKISTQGKSEKEILEIYKNHFPSL